MGRVNPFRIKLPNPNVMLCKFEKLGHFYPYSVIEGSYMSLRPFRILECPKYVQPYSTIFSTPKRQIDAQAFRNMKTTLLYVLRSHAGREHGFRNRDDGYVSVKQLVSPPLLSVMCLPQRLYSA